MEFASRVQIGNASQFDLHQHLEFETKRKPLSGVARSGRFQFSRFRHAGRFYQSKRKEIQSPSRETRHQRKAFASITGRRDQATAECLGNPDHATPSDWYNYSQVQTVVARLGQMGFESQAHLSTANTMEIVAKASEVTDPTSWKNSP
jgi:hypothetical protein